MSSSDAVYQLLAKHFGLPSPDSVLAATIELRAGEPAVLTLLTIVPCIPDAIDNGDELRQVRTYRLVEEGGS